MDGTAIAGTDYTSVGDTLQFANGETSKTFTFSIFNNSLLTQNKTVSLNLYYPSDGAVLAIPGNQATLTIADTATGMDFNGEGNADLIFQNNAGQLVAWYMNGSGSVSSSAFISSGGLGDWRVR